MLPIFFNNCSARHYNSNESLGSQGLEKCSMAPVFEANIHGFVTNKCSRCHIPGGVGKGAFAASNVLTAWTDFNLIGIEKFSQYATNPGHNFPYTGTQNEPEITRILQAWDEGLKAVQTCSVEEDNNQQENVDLSLFVSTKSLPINASFTVNDEGYGPEKTLTWDLGTDLLANEKVNTPDLSGVKVSIKVRVRESMGNRYYEFIEPSIDISKFNPSISVPQGLLPAIKIEGIKIKRNGEYYLGESTYSFVNKTIRKIDSRQYDIPDGEYQLSYGTMVGSGEIAPTDVLALSFGKIEVSAAPPPPPPIYVSLAQNIINTSEGEFVDVTVQLKADGRNFDTDPIELPISVTLNFLEQAPSDRSSAVLAIPLAFQENPRTVVNRDDVTIAINNFDWDFKEEARTVVFLPPEEGQNSITSKTIRIEIGDDQRYENDPESIFIQIGQPQITNARIVKEQNASNGYTRTEILIAASDAEEYVDPFDTSIQTYSRLMAPEGILGKYCLGCHNNAEDNGLDLTNYQQMLNEGRIIPGDTNSKIYQRMNPSGNDQIAPMPLNGFLPNILDRKKVEDWILRGAKNN